MAPLSSRSAARLRATLAALLLLAGGTAAAGAATAEAGGSGEYAVKAAFLFNFAKFAEWPAAALPRGAPLRICILGEDPFGATLDDLVAGERIDGHSIVVERIADLDAATRCHELYVGADVGEVRLGELFSRDLRRVLTVGESEAFLGKGGILRFRLDRNRVRFDLSLPASARSAVRVSSKLLRVARVVEP